MRRISPHPPCDQARRDQNERARRVDLTSVQEVHGRRGRGREEHDEGERHGDEEAKEARVPLPEVHRRHDQDRGRQDPSPLSEEPRDESEIEDRPDRVPFEEPHGRQHAPGPQRLVDEAHESDLARERRTRASDRRADTRAYDAQKTAAAIPKS